MLQGLYRGILGKYRDNGRENGKYDLEFKVVRDIQLRFTRSWGSSGS